MFISIIKSLLNFPSLYIRSCVYHYEVIRLNLRIRKYNRAIAKRGLEPLPLYVRK